MRSKQRLKILVLDFDVESCQQLVKVIESEGQIALRASTAQTGLEIVAQEHPEIVILELRMPDLCGTSLIAKVRQVHQSALIIMLTSTHTRENLSDICGFGVYDFLLKPVNINEAMITIRNALHTRKLAQEVTTLKRQIQEAGDADQIIGDCPAIVNIRQQIEQVSQNPISVCILGERGTGKESIAHAIHASSSRSQMSFISMDCSLLAKKDTAAILFGKEMTEAAGYPMKSNGLLAKATVGTLFIKDIEQLSYSAQTQLALFLEEQDMGLKEDRASKSLDIRLLAASQQDLRTMMKQGKFHQDLYYRLNEFSLQVPSLRERGEDIRMLSKYFLDKYNQVFKKNVVTLSPEAEACLCAYSWPGNISELQSTIKRAVIFAFDCVRTEHLSKEIAANSRPAAFFIQANLEQNRPMKEVSREVISHLEKELIQRALEKSGGNKVKTARWLEIDYKTLFTKMKQSHIRKPHGQARGVLRRG